MEEKSLEEIMAGLADESTITVASTMPDNEPLVVKAEGFTEQPIHALSQNPIQEVQEMVEAESFMSKNIHKDMSVLEKDFVTMHRKAAVVDAKIAKIKSEYREVFEKIAVLEGIKSAALRDEQDLKDTIARKLFLTGQKSWKGMEVAFTYVKASFKDKFNMDKFKECEPNVWAKYVEKSPVKEYIRTKLDLLPIRDDELNDEEVK